MDNGFVSVYKLIIDEFLTSWDYQGQQWQFKPQLLANLKDRLEYITIVVKQLVQQGGDAKDAQSIVQNLPVLVSLIIRLFVESNLEPDDLCHNVQ